MHLRLSPSTGWAYSRSYGRLYGLTCGRMRLPTKSARKTGRRTDGGSCCVTPLPEADKSLRHSDKSCSDSGIATKCTRIPAYRLPEHWQCHGTEAINRHLLRRGLGASPPAITPKGRIPPEPVNGDPARRIETFASLRANLANGARRRTLLSSEVHLPARPGAAITTSNAYSARTARPLTGRSRPWG